VISFLKVGISRLVFVSFFFPPGENPNCHFFFCFECRLFSFFLFPYLEMFQWLFLNDLLLLFEKGLFAFFYELVFGLFSRFLYLLPLFFYL